MVGGCCGDSLASILLAAAEIAATCFSLCRRGAEKLAHFVHRRGRFHGIGGRRHSTSRQGVGVRQNHTGVRQWTINLQKGKVPGDVPGDGIQRKLQDRQNLRL